MQKIIKVLLIVLSCIVLLLGIGAGIYLYINRPKEPPFEVEIPEGYDPAVDGPLIVIIPPSGPPPEIALNTKYDTESFVPVRDSSGGRYIGELKNAYYNSSIGTVFKTEDSIVAPKVIDNQVLSLCWPLNKKEEVVYFDNETCVIKKPSGKLIAYVITDFTIEQTENPDMPYYAVESRKYNLDIETDNIYYCYINPTFHTLMCIYEEDNKVCYAYFEEGGSRNQSVIWGQSANNTAHLISDFFVQEKQAGFVKIGDSYYRLGSGFIEDASGMRLPIEDSSKLDGIDRFLESTPMNLMVVAEDDNEHIWIVGNEYCDQNWKGNALSIILPDGYTTSSIENVQMTLSRILVKFNDGTYYEKMYSGLNHNEKDVELSLFMPENTNSENNNLLAAFIENDLISFVMDDGYIYNAK